ncbi:MAG: transposase domain-containing protein [Bacillota bacterium]|nr:transposase domain-containing protein [Bacillota bacterium]
MLPKSSLGKAIAYNINPFFYLKYLFEKLPNTDPENLEELDTLMPWSKVLPEECKLPKKE